MHEFVFKYPKAQALFHPGPFWDLVVESVEAAQQAGTKESTCTLRLRNLAFFIDWLHRRGVADPKLLTKEHISAFEEEMARRKPLEHRHSVNLYTGGVMSMMPAVMHFLKWLYWHGVRVEPTIEAAYYNRRRQPHPQLRARQGSSRVVRDISAPQSPTSPPGLSSSGEGYARVSSQRPWGRREDAASLHAHDPVLPGVSS